MLIVETLRYRDRLGSLRYLTILAVPSDSGYSLVVFDPGPPGAEALVAKKYRKIAGYLKKYYNARIKRAYALLTHTHPSAAGSAGYLDKALGLEVETYAHVRSVPLVERDKKPSVRLKHRFERNTEKALRLFKELSPVVYRPYYRRFVAGYSLPTRTNYLIPPTRSPDAFERIPLEIDADAKIERMRSAGHSYEHVVYRVTYEDFRGLFLGDEGPIIMGAFPIRYNDATSRAYALTSIEKRHEAMRDREEYRVFRNHGARKFERPERMALVTKYLNSLREAVTTEFESVGEESKMRVSDSAAAMLIRDYFAKYPGTIERSSIKKTHYLNAENLPVSTARAALAYLNGRGVHRRIVTRNLDPLGRYRYVEVITP